MKPSIILPAVLLLVSTARSDHGVKTARHAYSASASGSNSFANSFASGGGGGGIKVGVGSDFAGNPAFWWAGPNSPFQEAYEYFRRCSLQGNCGNVPGPFTGIPGNFPIPNNLPENGCNDSGCSFSGGFNVNDKNKPAGDFGPIDISKNPFLNGEFQGVSLSSCSGSSCPGGKPHSTITTTSCKGSDCKTNTQHGNGGDLNLQQNPFLNGAFGAAGAFGGAGVSGGSGCAGVKGGCKGAPVGCNGAPGCTEGSTSHEFAFHGQFGSGTGCSGGAGCSQGQPGSGGVSGSGSYGGSQGSTSFTGGNQGVPIIGGCAGTLGGCKPGQTTSPSGSGNQGVPNLIGGCAGTLGGCKPGETTGGFSGTTTYTGNRFSGTTTSAFGSPGQGQPGQNVPSTYPGQSTGHGSTSGSYSGSGSTTGSFGSPGQGQPGQNVPSTYLGQTTGHGSTSGSFSGSGSTTSAFGSPGQGQPGQNVPSTYPGQTTGHGSTSGSFSGSGSTSGSFGGTGQGQSGQPGHGSTAGNYAGSGSTAGSYAGSGSTAGSFGSPGQGQPGYGQTIPGQTTGHGSTSGSFSGSGSTTGSFGAPGQGQPGYGQNVPTSQPGQTTGHVGGGSYSGSTTSQTSFTQAYPGQAPGQPGYDGQPGQGKPGQPGYDGQPGQGKPGQPGYDGQPGQGKPGHPGYSGSTAQPSYTSGSQTPSGSFSGSFGSSTSKFDHKTGTQTTTGTFGPSGSQPGQPGYTSGTTQHGQTNAGSFSGSSSGSFGTSGYTSGTQNTHTTSGSLSGSGSTSGTYNQPGYTSGSQHTPSGGYTGSTGAFGSSGSFAGSSSFTGKTTPAGGDHTPAGGKIDGQLQMKCYGDGLVCVKKYFCNNGIVNTDGNGLLNVRDGEHYCDLQTETCCKLPNKSGHPFKETPIDIPNFPGGSSTFQSTNSHKSSSSSSSTTNSFGSTSQYFGSQSTRPVDIGTRYTPGPSAGGVLPGQVPSGGYQPGQSIPFGGSDGQSPGVIQVIPDGQTGSKTQGGGLQQYGPGEAPGLRTTPGLQHYGPGQAPGLRTTPGYGPTTPRFGQGNSVDATASGSDFTNELSFASTLKGPAYLPPGPSPSPSPSNYSPDLLPPDRSPSPTSPKPSSYYPSTPAPNNYYPTQKTTPAYLPPYAPTTKKPTTNNGYLPPQIPSESNGDNAYLPPPKDPEVPDSNIINISVLRPDKPDRDPQGTNGQETILRPTPRPTPRPTQRTNTEFQFNTTPYPGCAAALKCVTGDFCTAEGVISKTRVLLTPEQEINRVPLTECYDPESGIIGKCCRDPEYKDPWPSTQLGLFNPDQDGQGSNPGVNRQPGNDGKYRPGTKQPGVKGGRPNGPRPGGTRPFNPYEPNQIGSPSNNPNAVIRPGGYPSDVPNIPFDSRLVNTPQQVDVKPPVESRFDNKFPTSPVKNPETCGIRHPDAKPAGPGPIDAGFGEIPWQAMILRDTNRSLLCGGAIIRRDVILTAAHCVENLQANDVLVKGGEWKLGIDEEPKPFQINKVEAIVRHPGYRPENKLNDVALLILKDKFRLDRNVDTLCLPDPDEDVAKKFQNAKCITTGWGKTILQLNIVNSIMHILGVGIIQGNQCQQQLQQNHANLANLYNTNCVCGAPIQSQADICDVDVGSALACEGPDGRYTLAGVYSWDTGCNPTAQVAGYTRVDTHWVQQTLQRPIKDLKTEESGFYQQLAGAECHCLPGKK